MISGIGGGPQAETNKNSIFLEDLSFYIAHLDFFEISINTIEQFCMFIGCIASLNFETETISTSIVAKAINL